METLEQELSKTPITEVKFKMDSSEKSILQTRDLKKISKEQIIEEQKSSFKGGESNYASSRSRHRKAKLEAKKLKSSQQLSKEFQTVKNFLDKKGYDLIQSIGSGSYAEVYKAFHRNNKKTVAVKVIDLRKTEEHYRCNFLPNEVAVMKTCKHFNIIKIYQLIQTQNRVIMVMEFAPRGTMADWLKESGILKETTAHMVFTQIVDAIHCLHSNRIAHRDLKLENILLTQNYDPKISDFSYATMFGPNDPPLSTLFCGSLPYFSPEILLRKPHNPLISDIWSLGVCFYIILNDCLPFRVGDDRQMVAKQLDRDWKFRSHVAQRLTQPLKSMIKRMLEPDVQLRVTAQQLKDDPWIKEF